MKRLFLAVLTLSAVALAAPADPPALFVAANAAFQSGDYAGAARDYRAIADSGIESADVYYNLGTAELKIGRRGHAIVALERALRLDPQDLDVAFNLAEAQRGNIDKVVGEREEEPLLERIGARVPVEPVGWIFLGGWLTAIAFFVLRSVVPRAHGLLTTIGIVTLVAAGAAGGLLAAAAWQRSHASYAVVVVPMTSAREGPADDFKPAFEIHEGLKVRVVKREPRYLRIRLPNGVEGWVALRDVPII